MSTYHFVSHTHWDREWYLGFEEFRVRLVGMIDHLIRHMQENPAFDSFLFDGQTAMVLDYLEVKPERAAIFREYARAGRFHLGPWYILADEYLPDGESHIRNLQIGLATASSFGPPMRIGYLPDQFGHVSQMPQILRGFAIDTAMIYRGFGGEEGEEFSEYEWRAPDGSAVLMLHLPKDGYSFGYFARDTREEMLTRFLRLKKDLDARARTSHRLVLNGGDHFWVDTGITRALEAIRAATGEDCRHSNLPAYVEAIRSEGVSHLLPQVKGELRFGLRHAFAVISGTASSRVQVKQDNYRTEALLEKWLEPLSAIAALAGFDSRAEIIRHAWMLLLQNQDHDVICGASIDRVYEEASARFRRAGEAAHAAIEQILEDLAPRDEGAHGDDGSIFIFHPLPFERRGIVECTVEFHLQDVVIGINPEAKRSRKKAPPAGFRILSPEGEALPFQILGSEERYGIGYARHAYPAQTRVRAYRLLVDAGALRPLGFRRLTVERSASFEQYSSSVGADATSIENEFLRVEAAPDGTIAITDRRSGRSLQSLHLFEDGGDIGDGYTYCPPELDRVASSRDGTARIEIIERGPLRAALRVSMKLKVPRGLSQKGRRRSSREIPLDIESVIFLTAGNRRAEIRTRVRNEAENHRLRVLFPTGLKTNVSVAGSPFDLVRREHVRDGGDYPYEVPQNLSVLQRSVTIEAGEGRFTLLTRGLPEYELDAGGSGMLALTLLRCVGELSASNLATRPGGDAGWKNATPGGQCPGEHIFEYAVVPSFPPSAEPAPREEREYHAPLLSFTRRQAGAEPPETFLRAESRHAVFSAFKETEDRKGAALRFFNPSEEEDEIALLPGFPHRSAAVATLSEDVVAELLPDAEGIYRSTIPAHGILTVRFEKREGA